MSLWSPGFRAGGWAIQGPFICQATSPFSSCPSGYSACSACSQRSPPRLGRAVQNADPEGLRPSLRVPHTPPPALPAPTAVAQGPLCRALLGPSSRIALMVPLGGTGWEGTAILGPDIIAGVSLSQFSDSVAAHTYLLSKPAPWSPASCPSFLSRLHSRSDQGHSLCSYCFSLPLPDCLQPQLHVQGDLFPITQLFLPLLLFPRPSLPWIRALPSMGPPGHLTFRGPEVILTPHPAG